MNLSFKHLLALTALGLSLGVTAQAQPMMDDGPWHGGPHFERHRAQMQKFQEKRLAALKAKLKLTAAQEPAWQQFAQAHQPPATPQGTRLDRESLFKLTTPERLDRMQQAFDARHTVMHERMKQHADATRQFYAQLTPEQQKVFDAETLPRRQGPRPERQDRK